MLTAVSWHTLAVSQNNSDHHQRKTGPRDPPITQPRSFGSNRQAKRLHYPTNMSSSLTPYFKFADLVRCRICSKAIGPRFD